MRFSLVRCLALGAFFVALAVAFTACGGDSVPGNSVAKVDGTTVTKDAFNHWMTVAAKTQAQQSGASTAGVVAPVPPDYTACVAQLQKASKPVKGQPTPTADSLKSQCKTQYQAMRDQVLQVLIPAIWYVGEAKDQGVPITDKAVDAEFLKQKKQSFKTEKAYQSFLKTVGLTESDLKLQIRSNLVITKLKAKIVKGTDTVTGKAIATYYAKNKSKFAQPERRDIRIVLTKTRAKASAAKAALESGTSWNKVAKQYSTDQATKNAGGVLLAVTKGSQEQALDTAVFNAKANKLLGPIKTQFGYYVVEVNKISPASQQTQAQATPAIKQLLAQQQQDNALNTFATSFQKKWKGKTVCRSGYQSADLCKNAPKSSTTTATTDATSTG